MDHSYLPKAAASRIIPNLLAAFLITLSSGIASAHSEHNARYADAERGTDQGDCSNPETPCKTFDYVRSQAGKGDKVCLSGGTYTLDYKSSAVVNLKLFNRLITVRGDCGSDAGALKPASDVDRPVISGLPKSYAARLETLGLAWAPGAETGQTPAAQQDAGSEVRLAQAGGQRYVDGKTGTDQGTCADPGAPCKTISYAHGQAAAGDTINVAAGSYIVTPEESQLLLADDIRVQGGFSTATGFTNRGPLANPTYVIGLSHTNRAALKQRGFILLQDRKALNVIESITAARAEGAPVAPAQGPIRCVDGKAGDYPCEGVDYLSRVALHQFSSNPGAANDIWGFVDLNDEKEYALIGLENGSAVVDVTQPTHPRVVPAFDARDPANPTSTGDVIPGDIAIWRDLKVYQFYNAEKGRYDAYAYVTTDGPQGGAGQLQVLDLTGLPERVSLVTFQSEDTNAHNVYISNVDYATGVAISKDLEPALYILGSNLSPGGTALTDIDKDFGAFRIYSLKPDPAKPAEVAVPPAGTFYVHDATTLIVEGAQAKQCGDPDNGIAHDPCEVLIDYNEDSVDIWDVTDKSKLPIMLSSSEYDNSIYTHSGWWSADKKHVFIHDEGDEYKNSILNQTPIELNTTVRVMNIEDLRNPGEVKVAWEGPTKDIDHNGFTKGNLYYMSNYLRGLTVLDVTDPLKAERIAFFDTAPEIDDNDFGGAWGTYPYLRSGTILVSDIERGLIVVRLQKSQ
ncbi:MAG: choice-of-anchor B family protein [Hyphomicrobiales bacterium]